MFTHSRRRLALAGAIAAVATGALAGPAMAADDPGSDSECRKAGGRDYDLVLRKAGGEPQTGNIIAIL
jgi:hypothetical protein